MSSEGTSPREVGLVRPFILTGGRTTTARPGLRWETLVERMADRSHLAKTTEQRNLMALASRPVSIAELSAFMHLPTQVVVVLVSDLLDMGAIRVHQTDPVEIELSALTRMIQRVRAL